MPVSCGSGDSALHVGREYESAAEDLRGLLQGASDAKFDFVVIPLFEKLPADTDFTKEYELRPSTDSDLAADSKTWGSAVVGTLSDFLDPGSEGDAAKREFCRAALEKELKWASHLGVYGILLPPPNSMNSELYAAALGRQILGGICTTQLMVRIPLIREVNGTEVDGWQVWNTFRMLCDHSTRLHVALELTANLPTSESELERWFAEPIRTVIVPVDIFLTNKQGFPVLSKRHKAFLIELFKYRVQVIIQGLSDEEGSESENEKYLHYIARIYQGRPPLTHQEQFELPYHDYLQAPLQPLQDDLESQTYETFEKDPVKYVQYEEAILKCFEDKLAKQKEQPLAAIVVGAGRGPLVAAVRSAAQRAKAKVDVWAVEKNPNAIITLRHRAKLEGWDNVQIIGQDMRFWDAPRKADLLVSELLGSFGDNELSPECLDGAQRFLAADGVCIPQKYTSFLTPVSSPKLWSDVRNYNDVAHFETAYVVKFHQAFYPSKEIKECFTFSHPNWELTSNDRYEQVEFTAEVDALVHGFAGYFHCDLYGGHTVSISPQTYSVGMFSWFPIYFPLRTPVLIKEGQSLRSHWWRCHNDRKVWYEWAVSQPTPSPVHNPGGRAYYIGK